MRVLYLANRIPWFGSYSGYEQLPHHLSKTGLEPQIYSPQAGFLSRAAGKIVSLLRGHGRISQTDAAARARFELGLLRQPAAVGHLLYGEEHLLYWRDARPDARRRTILTLHQPRSQWSEGAKTQALATCRHAIILWRGEMEWFRSQLKGGTLNFIPHGVDTDFFCPSPASSKLPQPHRLLYVGVHLRNTAMLARIIQRLSARRDDLHFDLLVPIHRRSDPALVPLLNHPRVTWHAGLNDEELRALYRAASLLLLPLNDSGANTAVVEALACGLPVVTTDVGGIRDYGGETVFPLVKNNDDDAMLALLERYLDQPAWREEISRACRAFAETELAWPLIARRHAEVYRKMGA